MKQNPNAQRSSLGGHIAGTGMEGPTSKEFDDYLVQRGIKVGRRGMLPTDRFKNSKEFNEYVKQMSGDVTTYNIKKAPKE